MTPLEAVKELRILINEYKTKWDEKMYNHFISVLDTIETEIKIKDVITSKLTDKDLDDLKVIAKKLKAFDFIKQLEIISNQNVVEVQGQWYLISSTIINKSSRKIPITEEQAYMLKEILG